MKIYKMTPLVRQCVWFYRQAELEIIIIVIIYNHTNSFQIYIFYIILLVQSLTASEAFTLKQKWVGKKQRKCQFLCV
jgi:hypothetical protein